MLNDTRDNRESKHENGKISPNLVSLPKLPTTKNQYCMDSALLDFMGTDEFLSLMKSRTENNIKEIWKEMSSVCNQLKASRELISIGSNIHGNLASQSDVLGSENLILRLLQSTQIILGVDRVSFLQIDSSKNQFLIVNSTDKQSVGLRFDIPNSAEETVIKKNCVINIQDISALSLSQLESFNKLKINCLLMAPIIFGDKIIGVVECINKFSLPLVTPRDLVALPSVQFNGSDELSLSFISSIIGTVLFDINKKQQNKVSSTISPQKNISEKLIVSIEENPSVQSLLNAAYTQLEAERVAIFAYSDFNDTLICAVSQDLKGVTIPINKGLIGLTFTSMSTINVTDTLKDSRFSNDIDNQMGFTTKNIICVPILDSSGYPIGVIDARNKKNGPNFTESDEKLMFDISTRLGPLLSEIGLGSFSPNSKSRSRISYSTYMSSLLNSNSVPELLSTAESIVSNIIDSSVCDYMGLFVASNDQLLKIHSKEASDPLSGALKLYELPKAITEALQFGRMEEFISSSSSSNELSNFIPGANLFSALVIPLKAKFGVHSPGSTVLIFGKSSSPHTLISMNTSEKDLIRAFSDCFDCSLQVILNSKEVKEAKNNNSDEVLIHSLNSVEDFIIILDPEGKIKFTNEDRYELFVSALTPNNGNIVGLHYSSLINPDNSLKLYTDVSAGITSKAYASDVATVISSSKPYGVDVKYIINPLAKSGEVVVIVQQSNNIQIGDVSSNPFTVVDEASSMLEKFRKSFTLNDEIDANLQEISATLLKTSKRLSFLNLNASPLNHALQLSTIQLVNHNIVLPKNMFEWEFSTLEYKDALLLCNVVGEYFDTLVSLPDIGIKSDTLARFILEVAKNYHDRPFHNLQHASGVTHFTYMLLNATNAKECLKAHQVFAILLSAFVHDIDHPGNTNLFEINSNSHLAYLYNDQAVLENHHCATTFKIMRKDSMRILQSLPAAVASDIRKIIIGCVLATDMSVHFDLIEETKKRASIGWNFNEVKDQHILGKILVHAADLSNPVRPFNISKEWARRISVEFNNQVAKEEALGMPILGFMISKDDKTFCKNELNFASFLVQPMWRAIGTVFPQLDFLLQQLDSNLSEWKAWADKITLEEQKEEK